MRTVFVLMYKTFSLRDTSRRRRGTASCWSGWDWRPLLQLDMRLGEGTGAVLAMGVVEAAAATLSEMATFAEAGVSDRPPDETGATA